MPLAFPIATDSLSALEAASLARTIMDARQLAGEPVALVSAWLRPTPEEHAALKAKLDEGVTQGFVQIYEDAKGRPVAAVTFWKPKSAGGEPPPEPVQPPVEGAPLAEDHTDDLYFDKAQKTRRKKKGAPDPNQMDLFAPSRPPKGLTEE
jgi:hypothetical protein